MSGSNLAQRIGDSRTAQAAGTALVKAGAQPTSISQLFGWDRFRGEMMRVLNDEDMARRFLQLGLTESARVPKLAACSWQSMAGALLQCATVRLEPGPALGHAWVLPFKGSATFVLGYPGLAQLAWRSGVLQDMNAYPVCDGDDFFFDQGANIVSHKRPTRGRRGPAYAYYAIVRYANGGRHIEFMTREEVEDHAQRYSRSYQSESPESPWRTDFDKMACKTCVLQGKQYYPASSAWNAAVSGDEQPTLWTPASGLRPEAESTPLAGLTEAPPTAPEGVQPPSADEFAKLPENGNG